MAVVAVVVEVVEEEVEVVRVDLERAQRAGDWAVSHGAALAQLVHVHVAPVIIVVAAIVIDRSCHQNRAASASSIVRSSLVLSSALSW